MNEDELQRQAKHRLAILRHADEVSGIERLAPPSTNPPSVSPSTARPS